jgi:hypothetical protein
MWGKETVLKCGALVFFSVMKADLPEISVPCADL